MNNWTHGSSEESDWRRAAADHFIKVYDLDNDDEERTEGMIAGFVAIIDWYMADAKVASGPVEYPPSPPIGIVHERVDAIATFDSMAQCPSSPQVTPPKYDPSWHGSQAHTFVTDKPVGSEVKPRTGDKS